MWAKRIRESLLFIQIGLLTTTSLTAAHTSFNPSLALGQFYTSNVTFVGPEQESDTYTNVTLTFPVTIETPRSSATLFYSPSYQAFNEFPTFDNWSHALGASVTTRGNRTNSLSVDASYYHGQEQGRADSDLEGDYFLSRRSTRSEGRVEIYYSGRFSSTWIWGIGASAGSLSYEQISGTDFASPQDRDGFGGEASLGKQLSPRTALSFRGEAFKYSYDISGEQLLQLYSLGLSRSLSRRSTFEVSAGAYITDLDPLIQLPNQSSETATGFQGILAYAKSFKTLGLRLEAAHRPTLGSTRGGPSTSSYASLTLSRPLAKRIAGSFALRYARSAPIEEIVDGLESVSAFGNLNWSVLRALSLAFNVGYTTQSPLEAGLIPTSTESDVLTAGFSLVWFPLANRPIAQGPN